MFRQPFQAHASHPRQQPCSRLILQLELPILALGVQTRHLDLDRDLGLHGADVLVRHAADGAVVGDADGHLDAVPFVVAEAVFLHDALDEVGDG